MNRQVNTRVTQGFTLIELMLAMTFVSVLLVAIAMTVIQMANIYNRGMTVKELNQASREVTDDLRRTAASSEVFAANVDGSDTADFFIIRTGSTAIGGRLCMGSESYIWNYTSAVEAGTDANLTRVIGDTEPIRFVKVADTGKTYCMKSGTTLSKPNILAADATTMTTLVKPGDHSLGVLNVTLSSQASAYDAGTGQRMYTMGYILGTGQTSAMNLSNYSCLPPSDANSNLTYCNIQPFSIVLRVGSAVN